MALPVHRWYRYSAGFAAQWVEQVLHDWNIRPADLVLDPFAGSGTVPIVCDTMGLQCTGVEAHPAVARICKTKLLWETPIEQFASFTSQMLEELHHHTAKIESYLDLVQRSFDNETLLTLDCLKMAWLSLQNQSNASELSWLALTAILRPSSSAGIAQWQYILPNKTKKKTIPPLVAFQKQIEMMKADIYWMQSRA